MMDSEYYREMEYLCAPEPDWGFIEKELEWEATPDYDELMEREDGVIHIANSQDEEDLWDMGFDAPGPDPDIAYEQYREAQEWGI